MSNSAKPNRLSPTLRIDPIPNGKSSSAWPGDMWTRLPGSALVANAVDRWRSSASGADTFIVVNGHAAST